MYHVQQIQYLEFIESDMNLPHLLPIQLIIALLIFKLANSQTDSYLLYFNSPATAMDFHYATNKVVFSNLNYQILLYDAVISTNISSPISTTKTTHKAKISTLAISPNGTLVLSGGRDYTARVHILGNNTPVCVWDQLRGSIISSKIGSDNDLYALGSNEGYLYYGTITNCTITKYNKTDYKFKSIEIIMSRNQIWVADGQSSIVVVNISNNNGVDYSLPTPKVVSLMQMQSSSLMGVCTSRAFYLLDYSIQIKYTLKYPSLYTHRCRIKDATGGRYYLIALAQVTFYKSGGATIYPIWNIWTVQTSIYNSTLYIQQKNTWRYGVSNSIVNDAVVFDVQAWGPRVVSISEQHNPLYNFYADSGSCSGQFYRNGNCQKCNWDTATRAYCLNCSAAPVCNSCSVYTVLVTVASIKYCASCPLNCYACNSTTTCTTCFGGYSLVSGACVDSNITGCANTFWNSSASISQCYQCEYGYMAQNNETCKPCDIVYANCSRCNQSQCLRCQPNFVMMSSTSTNCQICSHAIEGCAACLNQTWCDTCYQEYPYFDIPNSTYRFCKRSCYYSCLTCERFQFDICKSCDSNRTLYLNVITNTNQCICKTDYPIENTTSWQCQACRDYIPNCINCSSKTFCTTCDTGFYFNDINSTDQTCKICNYTCATCTTTWYKCDTCDTTLSRVLDPISNRCVCQSVSYFQYGSQVKCQLCADKISNCDVCHNQTYCVTCLSTFYVKSTGTGTNMCDSCATPCLQCFGTSSNCTDCSPGRQLNYTTRTCDCLTGYYATGLTACAPCAPLLGSCLSCNNNTTCLTCWENNYFSNQGSKRVCDLCQTTCLTCATWNYFCATCDPLANRVLNTSTKQCDCMVGYTQTDGRCLNCTATFDFCTSCNATTCFSCEPGYSLAYGGLKCVDCQATYPGCTLCLNGVCAACNQTSGYQLSYSKCICKPGRYFKQLECLPYAMGKSVQRLFQGYSSFKQSTDTGLIQIKIYFRCEGVKVPYGIANSIVFTVNDVPVTSYQVQQFNTTFTFKFMPEDAHSMGYIKIQFKNKTLFDLDQYGPANRIFQFQKNIYHTTSYEISSKFSIVCQTYIIPAVRWAASILILLGCADMVLMLVFTIHLLPAFLLLGLSPPMYLQNVLESMIKISYKSLFVFADINVNYEDFGQYTTYTQVFGASGGTVNKKIMDLVFMGCILAFYGILCPKLAPYVPAGKLQKLWEYKFVLKKYSNVSNILLCFLPSFLVLSLFDLRIQKYNPSLTLSIGIAAIILAFSGVFVFLHAMILYSTQFNDSYKNQDCYFGSSILEAKSITYILSFIIIMVWSIPMLAIIDGIYCVPILIIVMIWHMSHFRFWDNFPNKILYFLKIFYSVFLLLYIVAFLIFSIGQRYNPVQIGSLELMGLCTMVNIIVLFSFSAVQTVFLFIHCIYKQCKMSPNVVDNIEEEKQKSETQSNEGSSVYNMKIRLAQRQRQQTMFDAKLTNKQEHMRKFREHYLKTTTEKMYTQSKTQQGFNSTGFSIKSNGKKQK